MRADRTAQGPGGDLGRDFIEETLLSIEDELECQVDRVREVRKDYVRQTHPERACVQCDYVADPGEEFESCCGLVGVKVHEQSPDIEVDSEQAKTKVDDPAKSAELILCYIENNWAYFTTQNLSDQWGDDWDDAPYEHNAGEPYYHDVGDDRYREWQIVKVAFDGPFSTPAQQQPAANSPYSVRNINAGAVPWLKRIGIRSMGTKSSDWDIRAGTTLPRFVELVTKAGGYAYGRIADGRSGVEA